MAGISTKAFVRQMRELMPVFLRGMLKMQSDAVTRGHMTVPQFLALGAVVRRGPLKMGDLAAELGVSTPAATGIVERLHAMGMVSRGSDPKDRRVIRIAATARGQKTVRTLMVQRGRMIGKLFGPLSAAERAAYLKIVRKVSHVAAKSGRS